MCKLMETIIKDQIVQFLLDKGLINLSTIGRIYIMNARRIIYRLRVIKPRNRVLIRCCALETMLVGLEVAAHHQCKQMLGIGCIKPASAVPVFH
jgi:GTP cyclohydrolase I